MIVALFLAVAETVTFGLDIYLKYLVLLPVILVTFVLVSTIVADTTGLHTLSLAYKLNSVACVKLRYVFYLYNKKLH